MVDHTVTGSCFCFKRSTFDIFKIILKLTISAEPSKRFCLNQVQFERHTLGKVAFEIQAQHITYVIVIFLNYKYIYMINHT